MFMGAWHYPKPHLRNFRGTYSIDDLGLEFVRNSLKIKAKGLQLK
jgi:hypothetical protein